MSNYIILLPPSETKKKSGDETKPYRIVKNLKKYNHFISLETDREYVYGKLREAIAEENSEEIERTFELKGDKLHEAIDIISDLLNENTLPAIERYQGVMFNSIDYNSFKEPEKKNFDESTIFIDAMFGLLKTTDYIPNYKLKITSKFLDMNITKFWKERLEAYFDTLFREKLIIDILPQSHRKIVNYNGANVIKIRFCTIKNDKLADVGHDSKKLKGEIIRYIISKNFIRREDLEEFSHSSGYKYSKEHSKDDEIVYMK